jgi:glucose/arabinose dehydrogenase
VAFLGSDRLRGRFIGSGPWTFGTEEYRITVTPVVTGLSHPWSLAFLPNGDILVTERAGRLRLIRGGALQEQPIAGVPAVREGSQEGLLEIALHPRFAENGLLYLTYSKPGPMTTVALTRARFDGSSLSDVSEIFVADARSDDEGNMGSRLAFLADETLLMTTGERHQKTPSQDPSNHAGKILRLRDDGNFPQDNPFVGRTGFKPEIYTLGNRNPHGLVVHPETGAILANEHGPRGGDELNQILPGRNYGWPLVTYGVNYDGTVITDQRSRTGMEAPLHYWVPSIAPSGLAVYTGSRFPKWRDNLFLGAMADRSVGRQLYRIDLKTQPIHQESMLSQLGKRIRDVRQGPDGLLYVLTDAKNGSLLRLEPAP